MLEQNRAPAPPRFNQRAKCGEPRPFAGQALFIDIAKPLARLGKILSPPEHMCRRRIAVAPRPSGFLIIAFDRFGQAGMRDKADVRLVDPHPEGNRCNHNHIFGRDKISLIAPPDAGV